MIRYAYKINGIVQGVGFRPFIYQLAMKHNLCGFVNNSSDGVHIEVQGLVQDLELFDEDFYSYLPPLAHIDFLEKHPVAIQESNTFEIIQTDDSQNKTTLVSPDIKVCNDCIADLKTQEKYKNYFAVNCTNCGPRYSIIKTVPYDRCNTSMNEFTMCESCSKEYTDPLNRRYHAQPISCNDCGPKLELLDHCGLSQIQMIQQTAQYIKDGHIVAVKGIGGFHIICDATNDEVIQKLRAYKNRPHKPFALMCKDIDQIKSFATVSPKEEEILLSKEAPIVLLNKKINSNILSNYVALGINKIGCFLPYTPLHILLFEYLDNPIIATSANLGGEPIIIQAKEIQEKLPFVEYILDNNRAIINAIDDSVVQVVNDQLQILRLSRGYAPKVITLPFETQKNLLAVGANSKNTIALAFEKNIILSPYIGDLNSLVAFEFFERTVQTFHKFYDFEPEVLIHDMHPNYETTKWAKMQNKPLFEVQHHLAHIYAVKAEYHLQNKEYVGFSFDGTGYGTDGTLWGGEIFVNDQRIYSFKQIKLLGATKAIKEPRRVALAMLFEKYSLEDLKQFDLPLLQSFSQSELQLLYQSYQKNLNTFSTSSVGRLFDAVASLSDMIQIISYEGQSGLLCENAYDRSISDCFEYEIVDDVIELKIIDFIVNNSFDERMLSSMLINTLVKIVLDISKLYQYDVILTGGVFQNKTLLEKIYKNIGKNKKCYTNHAIPVNDSGIAVGQVFKYLMAH